LDSWKGSDVRSAAGASLRRLRAERQWIGSTFELILLAVLWLVAIRQDETDVRYLRNTMVKKRYGSCVVQAGRGRVHNCLGVPVRQLQEELKENAITKCVGAQCRARKG
jgi:hypothetical protein